MREATGPVGETVRARKKLMGERDGLAQMGAPGTSGSVLRFQAEE